MQLQLKLIVDKVTTAILAAILVLTPMSYVAYTWESGTDADIVAEEEIDHSKHPHAAPQLNATLVDFEGQQFVTGNVIHDHPMEVRVEVTVESAEGIDEDLIATEMDGSWTYDIDVEDRSEDITITFLAHNLPEDTWSDNFTIIIEKIESNSSEVDNESDDLENNTGDNSSVNDENSTISDNSTEDSDNETGVNNPPVCDVGPDLTSEIHELVYLDASSSSDPDGDDLTNPTWSIYVDDEGIIYAPQDSNAAVNNPNNLIAEFTPDVVGNYTLEFYVDDGAEWCKNTIQLTAIHSVPSIMPHTVEQSLTKGTAMNDVTFTNSGGYIETWEISPTLPNGLNFDSYNGMISGTPSQTIPETTFIVYANNSVGSATASVKISVIESGYDANDLAQFWLDFFQCQTSEDRPMVDDLDTNGDDNFQCEVSITLNETHVIITTNGIPNHDFESTLACTGGGDCTSEKNYVWSIPRNPTNDTTGGHDSANCPEADGAYACAPDRGAVAVAINGVPIYGPEDGPGGDAVAAEHGAYNEDRQPIELGICHGHAAQGGTYHYHADGNCMHWHPEEGESIENDYDDSTIQAVAQNTYDGNHSKVIGVAYDGYPIYGFWGYDDNMDIVEMKSSYELKDGETGYNGIDDYRYIDGLGHLDVCNGHFGPTPDFPQGIYHYHTTMQNGDGEMGFPYFLICYHGEADMSSDGGNGNGGGDPCAGYGETWGPGIGPPPEGCGAGSQSIIEQSDNWQFDPMILLILLLCLGAGNTLRKR
jgi:hypothetical protein